MSPARKLPLPDFPPPPPPPMPGANMFITHCIHGLDLRLFPRCYLCKPVRDLADEAPLIAGCRIVDRGDGFYTCRIHYRYWKKGSEICPGATGR